MAYHTRMSPGLRRWLPPVTRIFLPLGVAAALYAPVLTLPYFWDDYPQYNFATATATGRCGPMPRACLTIGR